MTDAVERAMRGEGGAAAFAPVRRAALARARRHSRTVGRLRWLLPTLCAVLIISFWGSAIVGGILRGSGLQFGGVDLAALVDGELVMAEPDISGTINGRRFEVTAERAVQDVTRQDEVRFESPSAVLDGPQGRIDVTAGSALYGIETETLMLDGGVDVRTVRGQTARLERASVDLAAGSLTSDAPVTLNSPQGTIAADSIRIEESGARVLFTGRVRARFSPSAGDGSTRNRVGGNKSPASTDPVPEAGVRPADAIEALIETDAAGALDEAPKNVLRGTDRGTTSPRTGD